MAKAIMIQGTMSNVGKSLITAGLCRVFKQDGYRTAPFKSQNMALNSYITEDGLEMGRAQAVQAEAAGIRPQADMNPILLKPVSDSGSQVIVHGVPIGNMAAREYFAYKKKLLSEVEKAYRRLETDYDIVVIEGAGSPAEINLRKDDIANMGMAKLADAPVLLVGDIDRGGVFAQLYGTVALLTEDERARVKGLVVNKFRGDKAIFDPGISILEELCGIRVMGVVPCADVDIEDEDSLGCHLRGTDRGKKASVDIAVIKLPRISNFTDFQVFTCLAETGLRYVERLGELGSPDLIILPGTKNTIEDLLWMRENGLEAAVLKLASCGVPVFGVCGGFQMLGELLEDPLGVETDAYKERAVKGLGLLPVKTVFGKEKMRTRVTGSCACVGGIFRDLSGMEIEGYEIHMGETMRSVPPMSYVIVENGSHSAKMDGCQRNHIYGTYIHGFFDRDGIAETIVGALLKKKGLPAVKNKEFHYRAYRSEQYDRLADVIRGSFDMRAVYDMMQIRREGTQ